MRGCQERAEGEPHQGYRKGGKRAQEQRSPRNHRRERVSGGSTPSAWQGERWGMRVTEDGAREDGAAARGIGHRLTFHGGLTEAQEVWLCGSVPLAMASSSVPWAVLGDQGTMFWGLTPRGRWGSEMKG